MTLKVRLAAMMIIILMAAMAFQYVLAEREHRDLVARLDQLSADVAGTTQLATQWTHQVLAGDRPPGLDRILSRLTQDSVGTTGDVRILVADIGDTVLAGDRLLDRAAAIAAFHGERAERDSRMRPIETEGSSGVWIERQTVEVIVDTIGGAERAKHVIQHRGMIDHELLALADSAVSGGRSFTVNVAVPAFDGDDPYTLQVSYPFEEIVDELERSRRRSLMWLAALIGMGAVGATIVAGRFTQPIQSLQRSIHRVGGGALDVTPLPERDDEIGRLNTSFNRMVTQLRETRAMEQRLTEAERMAALGRMAAGVAHEVRNPLNAMLLTMQQLRDKIRAGNGDPAPPVLAPAEFERYYGLVTGELARLDQLVGGFLDLTRSDALHVQSVDVGADVTRAVELFRPDAEARGVDVRAEIDAATDLTVEGDPSRLASIWNNLLSNALVATPAGGHIVMRVAVDGDDVRVECTDDGAGIEPDALARIWEPFYSSRADGAGLGLSIVRTVVEQHGGRVDAVSTPGSGTIIRIWLARTTASGGRS